MEALSGRQKLPEKTSQPGIGGRSSKKTFLLEPEGSMQQEEKKKERGRKGAEA